MLNPAYKGKYQRRQIPNPDYKGVWHPRQLQNPEYFEVDAVFPQLLPIGAVGMKAV